MLIEYFVKFPVSEDTLFWVFSSIVQSLLALVALTGVVTVFKYQSMSTREDRLLEELNKGNSDLAMLGGKLTATSGMELLKNIKQFVPELPTENDGYRIIKLRQPMNELESHNFLRGFLSKYMLRVTIYAFTVVLFSLFELMVTEHLSANPYLSLAGLYLSLFLVADVLRLVIRIIAETLLGEH